MGPIYKNFIYDEDRGFLFAYVPKVACTNWKSLLRHMAGQEDWLDNRRAHDKENGGLRYLDLSKPEDQALLQNPILRKYAMVRDPYSRILSAYLNKVEARLPVSPQIEGEDHFCAVVRDIDRFRQEHLSPADYPEINFEVFLRWLQHGKSWFTKDEHWTAQATLLRQPEVRFELLGRFENMTEDAAQLLHAMGCDQGFPSQRDVNFSPTKATEKMAQYYTKACQEHVKTFFAADFILFGYPTEYL